MPLNHSRFDPKQVAAIIHDCLRQGKPVEIEGFGTFHPSPDGGFRFIALDAPRVFISYATEDAALAENLYDALSAAGFNPWMDRRNLKAGQTWPRLIEAAIEASDFFIACLSTNSVNKRGGFQAEIRYALDIARRLPLEDTFLIPIRFDDCRVPARIRGEIQYIDLFPDSPAGIDRVIRAIAQHSAQRRASS
ncbi:MAG: TIR domain-containing protein [Acidobacteriota bacterium]